MAGKEFRAVFMSTAEPVNAQGKTTNPTKSPCDRYVFNTVLTRSKSLVLVVGSPYALLRTEQHMTGEQGMCWNLYMRFCMENGTFVIPESVEHNDSKRHEFHEGLKTKLYGIREKARPPQSSLCTAANLTNNSIKNKTIPGEELMVLTYCSLLLQLQFSP